MASFRTLRVTRMLSERSDLQRVVLDDGSRAYNLPRLTGPVAVGNEVVVNTTAVALGLGTGGWHVVHWNLAHRELDLDGGGHIMKLRYTSLQSDVGSVGERTADNSLPIEPTGGELAGVPVVVCSLHSQMAVVAAAFAHHAPQRRLVYVMTDGAALPLALSDLAADLRSRELIRASVTCGHAFGGDFEAVSVASALTAARQLARADAIVVAMGPGVVGTATALDTSALEVGPILDTVAALGGIPIFCIRASAADPRVRHRGISHHVLTVLDRFVHCRVTIAVPHGVAPQVLPDSAAAHDIVYVEGLPDSADVLDGLGLNVTTMGRTPAEDPLFFSFAAAAGTLAARILDD